jgi:hypothetical protein
LGFEFFLFSFECDWKRVRVAFKLNKLNYSIAEIIITGVNSPHACYIMINTYLELESTIIEIRFVFHNPKCANLQSYFQFCLLFPNKRMEKRSLNQA